MAASRNLFFLLLLIVLRVQCFNGERQVYIVYMGGNHLLGSAAATHLGMLEKVVDNRMLEKSLLRSYTRSFNGFAANLTAEERDALAGHEDVVSIFASITHELHTTRSWDFMGFREDVGRSPAGESDTIIGVIDTGIWPEADSFRDEGFGPPPKKWKGACNGGWNFTCNNKLIGARYYTEDSARDGFGHGTHSASTAAGNTVKSASFYGIAEGTARGGVPSARIAAYKGCCESHDLLAAFDDAIADGVDIISISIGGVIGVGLDEDPIGIGSLHAFQKGVLVVQSAGNSATKSSLLSIMPWIFTVAASNTDRGIVTKVGIGNGRTFMGKGVNSFALARRTRVPVVYGENVTFRCDKYAALRCDRNCLEPSLVKGKIVLCSSEIGVVTALWGGATGVVFTLDPFQVGLPAPYDFSQVYPLTASLLNGRDFDDVVIYTEFTKSPTLDIFKSESVRNHHAPKVAGFSSRGPNIMFPDILKPDITAPRVEILAAYPPDDNRSVSYNILSGTSMSCPHVSGAAAYVKSFHPSWSPSAIKSALMTTAWAMNASQDSLSLAEFSYGAGHVDPVRAVDPGLVYEAYSEDYITIFCSMGYNTSHVQKIFGANTSCPFRAGLTSPKDLNYPAMTCQVDSPSFTTNFTRTVKNVGSGSSRYTVKTSTSPYYNITVEPAILEFQSVNQKRSFRVFVSGDLRHGNMLSASLEWSDGLRTVRTPIVVYGK